MGTRLLRRSFAILFPVLCSFGFSADVLYRPCLVVWEFLLGAGRKGIIYHCLEKSNRSFLGRRLVD